MKKRKRNFSSYTYVQGNSDRIGCKVTYEEGLPNIWGNAQIFPHGPFMRRPLDIYDFATAPFWTSISLKLSPQISVLSFSYTYSTILFRCIQEQRDSSRVSSDWTRRRRWRCWAHTPWAGHCPITQASRWATHGGKAIGQLNCVWYSRNAEAGVLNAAEWG
jgi:hypothetical protein